MLRWFKVFFYKLKLIKEVILSAEPVPKVNNRDIDLEEITNRDKLIRKLSAETKTKDKDQLICPSCGATAERLVKCHKCHKEICEECATYCAGDPTGTIPSGYFCDECW